MFNRRSFLRSSLPPLAWAALSRGARAAQTERSGLAPASLFELVVIRLELGEQVKRLLAWFEQRGFPLLNKHRFGTSGCFAVEVGPGIPSVLVLRTYRDLADFESAWARLVADPDWAAAHAELEQKEPAFYREDSMLLRATPFSPPLKPFAAGDPVHKIFELRIYESPTWRQLGDLHARFAGGEIDLFHKNGIHPVLYADTVVGPSKPNMAYLIPFESEAHREKAWTAFREDPGWQQLRDESIRRTGEIVRNVTNMILTPTSFSMIR